MHKLIVMLCLMLATNCYAVQTGSDLDARVAHLTEQLRCLVCQNQSIAESQADLAMDLKREVREMLEAGKSDAEVRDFMVERYGDFVLYDPPMKTSTLLLWLGPLVLFLAAIGAFIWRLRQRSREQDAAPPDEAELAKARALLTNKDEQ
ncbi:cytochrome c-type biogenesis protein [Uliginosibacterium gangwonense]|uniref:cytochrome c-type biogenesis protein n=1 Tax=Uliginosibacterium gangwonense TaxID=392736 RepID=UPI000380BE1F|nr:cytochrome c-type biogenesis protein [Uliginosibacterium gangwonense]